MTTMDAIEQYRPLLFSIAYRMLGSVTAAEDAVQDAYVRWMQVQAEAQEIRTPKAWLTTTTTRICLDVLKSARVQRETYIGPWLPEPLAIGSTPDIADTVADIDSLSTAFLVLLESLSPRERAIFLLHDVFDYDFSTIAGIVNESEANCRQLARRARGHIAARRPRFTPPADARERLARRFMQAIEEGDLNGLISTLAEDVTIRADGGGVVQAARKPVIGREKAATFLHRLTTRLAPLGTTYRLEWINGGPGLVTFHNGQPYNAVTFTMAGDEITAIFIVVNPEKLSGLRGMRDERFQPVDASGPRMSIDDSGKEHHNA